MAETPSINFGTGSGTQNSISDSLTGAGVHSSISASSSFSLLSLISTSSHFTKLTSENYPTWKKQLEPYLKGHGLFGWIDGSKPKPLSGTLEEIATLQQIRFIALDFHFVHEKVANGTLFISFLHSRDQLADALTKALPYPRFTLLRSKLGLLPFGPRGDTETKDS